MDLYSIGLQKLYVALFARPADPAGYIWLDEFSNHGQDYSQINVFTGTAEYQQRFTGMQFDDLDNYNLEVVKVLYQGMFNRYPDAEGLAFFGNMLDTGEATIASIALHIMDGAQGDDLLALTNKAGSAQMFTDALDTDTDIAAYVGQDAIEVGQSYLDPVGSDAGTIPTSEQVEAAVGILVSDGSGF